MIPYTARDVGSQNPRRPGARRAPVRLRHPAAERLRRCRDRLDGPHSGAHRLRARRARVPVDPSRSPSPSRARSRCMSASTIWNCCGAPASSRSFRNPPTIRLEGAAAARQAGLARFAAVGLGEGPVIGVSPGAAFGSAKRWLPERFAAAATRLAKELGASVAIFGRGPKRDVCRRSRFSHRSTRRKTSPARPRLAEFIDLAAACRLYLTNDSGPMHIASALGVPTVAVFGSTNHLTTGPTGPSARVVRQRWNAARACAANVPSTIAA